MRLTDLFLAFPALILAAAVAAAIGPSLVNTMLALSTVFWPWYARLVRGQVLTLREREFILAARLAGAGTVALDRGTCSGTWRRSWPSRRRSTSATRSC